MTIDFVTGCARSGTSLTMQLLEACGADLGETNKLYEIPELRDRTIKPYLSSIGADPMGQKPLPELNDIKPVPDWRERIEKAVGRATIAKAIKGVLIWPLFAEHFPDSRYVVVKRDPLKIADSCKRASFMNKYSTVAEWASWVYYYHERCNELAEALPDQVIFYEPDAVINGETGQLERVVEFLGLTWNNDALKVIDPERWHK